MFRFSRGRAPPQLRPRGQSFRRRRPPRPQRQYGPPAVRPLGQSPPNQAAQSQPLQLPPPNVPHPLVPTVPQTAFRFPPPRRPYPRGWDSPERPPTTPDPDPDWEPHPPWGVQPDLDVWGRQWGEEPSYFDLCRWEQRMRGVGRCLSNVATVLEQLNHAIGRQNLASRNPQLSEFEQGVVREAAAQAMSTMLCLPLEPEDPSLNEGPGVTAFRRVAMAAEEAPLEILLLTTHHPPASPPSPCSPTVI
ncbi:unnamed protein product [Closterium sp. Naga37s-1]|nr:unnamed protein product [Closterium sp. Naga37s-1]